MSFVYFFNFCLFLMYFFLGRFIQIVEMKEINTRQKKRKIIKVEEDNIGT